MPVTPSAVFARDSLLGRETVVPGATRGGTMFAGSRVLIVMGLHTLLLSR